MRQTWSPAQLELSGSWEEVTEFVTRVIDAGIVFDCQMRGWTEGSGHIESRFVVTIEPDDDTQAAMIKLMLP